MSYEVVDFQKEVIERSFDHPVLVDFWAEWCGPCRMLGPILEKLAQESAGKWSLAKVNTEVHQNWAMEYRIRSIPAVKLFIDGKVAEEFTGALPEHSIRQWLSQVLPGANHQLLVQAKQFLAAGQIDPAIQALQSLIREEPDNDEGRVLLARIYLVSQQEELQEQAVALIESLAPDSKFYDVGDAIRVLVEMGTEGYLEALPPSPHQELLREGIQALQQGRFDVAVARWIEVLPKEKAYREPVRKACIAVFKFLGEDSETTRRYRPEFASALYV